MDPFAVPMEVELPASLRLVGQDEQPATDAAPSTERELVSFFVPLRPRTKGSLKPVRVPHSNRIFLKEQISEGPAWRERCATEAQDALSRVGATWLAYPGDVRVEIEFRFARRSGDDRERPTSRYYGDLDKLTRNAWDALVDAGVIQDDSLVSEAVCSKVFSDPGTPVGAWVQVVAL